MVCSGDCGHGLQALWKDNDSGDPQLIADGQWPLAKHSKHIRALHLMDCHRLDLVFMLVQVKLKANPENGCMHDFPTTFSCNIIYINTLLSSLLLCAGWHSGTPLNINSVHTELNVTMSDI